LDIGSFQACGCGIKCGPAVPAGVLLAPHDNIAIELNSEESAFWQVVDCI